MSTSEAVVSSASLEISEGVEQERSPWAWVPSLYFQQGLPVIVVQQVSVILYKRMGVENDQIAFWTSLISWPWILKILWAPLVDLHGRRRDWVLWAQVGITAALFLAGLAISTTSFWPLSLTVFFLMAFLSSTHDIALDGYYLITLSRAKQAFFAGITSTAFRMAMIFGSGAMVVFAGYLEKHGVSTVVSWERTLWLTAAIYGILMLLAFVALPKVSSDRSFKKDASSGDFREAIVSFFSQPGIIPICLFILFYRFGESMLTKMSGLFMLDPKSLGGVGLDTLQVGMILGNIGMVSLTVGGLLGGFTVAKYGIRKCLWPMAAIIHVPNLLYVWAAHAQPETWAICGVVAIEQFGYGFGLASYMVYTMYVCQRTRFQTTHYAIAMGFMSLGAMLAGSVSGALQMKVGYFWFFVAVCLATLPGLFLLRLIPLSMERKPA